MAEFAELPTPPGTRFSSVRLVERTGSTNADLLAEAQDGVAAGAVLVTDHQTAGRGRQRRAWHDEPGSSLLVSVLLRPRIELVSLIPLAAGLAVVDAVEAVAADAGVEAGVEADQSLVGLKWPNDVLAPSHGERKLAGILGEAVTTAGELAVVVGTGMNLVWRQSPPDEVLDRAVTLSELVGTPVVRQPVLEAYLVGLDRWLGVLENDGALIEAYRGRCLTLGRPVRFQAAGTEYRGVAADVSPTGTLLLDTDDGQRVELNAGDAHHL